MTTNTEAMRSALLPCPFCGKSGDDLMEYHNPKTILHPWFRIECDFCGAKGPGSDRGDHVQEWNNRAALAQVEQRQEFNGLTPQETNASASIMGMVDKQASGVSYEDEYLMTAANHQPEEPNQAGA